MIKKSLLRQSAQKYATGNVKKADYILYRKELLDAIDNGAPLPEMPEAWLRYKGSGMNPELQTLMTQLHQMDEAVVETKAKSSNIKKIVVITIGAVLILILLMFFFMPSHEKTMTQNNIGINQVDNIFISNSRKIIKKRQWTASDIQIITRQWNKLNAMEKTALKRHAVVQQLKSNAILKLQDVNSSPTLKYAIKNLLDTLN